MLFLLGESKRATAFPLSASRGRETLDAWDGRRLVEGLGGGDASVAYGEPGIGARGCPRSYDRGDAWFAAKRSLDTDLRRVCFLGAGVGDAPGEGAEFSRAVEWERRRARESAWAWGESPSAYERDLRYAGLLFGDDFDGESGSILEFRFVRERRRLRAVF